MAHDRVIIEELFLRLPAISAEVAREVSLAVAARIGHGLSTALPARSLGAVDIVIEARPGASREELIESVATAVLRAVIP
ncbi:hypothetical protein [Actinoplanes sp. CA-252034]|uniref:hypothetical protein n=1 Tax=Actinoplanes sp. CA-252034 TaxID=3239906 RepID=UPI003D99BFD8